jgi:lysophospholipase L1-like esterase
MDINAQFTMNGMTPEDTTRYWADPVHPSGEGYRLMGQLIGKHLDGLIRC